jgi:hypothetical protein
VGGTVIDRVVVSAEWLGDAFNGTQTAAVLHASAPGIYVMDLPTRQHYVAPGRYEPARPKRLVIEIAPPDADLLQLARDLIGDEPRWEGHCVFCRQPAHAIHVDDCLVARARRHLALIEAQRSHPSRQRRTR